jgi:hypothetical protein
VWEDVGFLSLKGESEAFLFFLYYAIVLVLTSYSYFKIDKTQASVFFRSLYEQYGRLDWSESALERDTEYSDALIQDYVQRQATFHPYQPEMVETHEEDRAEIRKAYPELWGAYFLFFLYALLNLQEAPWGFSFVSEYFESFYMPELTGKEFWV